MIYTEQLILINPAVSRYSMFPWSILSLSPQRYESLFEKSFTN